MQLTQTALKEMLSYDPATGIFVWIVDAPWAVPGQRAGTRQHDGYRRIGIRGIGYVEHRLAWLYMTGSFPSSKIDHRNRIRDQNHWTNLRLATHRQNCQNKKCSGATLHRSGKWQAQIKVNGKSKYLGLFDDRSAAERAYLAAKSTMHPFWSPS